MGACGSGGADAAHVADMAGAAEGAVDDLHVLGVDAHRFLPFIGST